MHDHSKKSKRIYPIPGRFHASHTNLFPLDVIRRWRSNEITKFHWLIRKGNHKTRRSSLLSLIYYVDKDEWIAFRRKLLITHTHTHTWFSFNEPPHINIDMPEGWTGTIDWIPTMNSNWCMAALHTLCLHSIKGFHQWTKINNIMWIAWKLFL